MQIRKNKHEVTELRFLGDILCKNCILNKLQPGLKQMC